jgi:hypothetical protein
MTNPVAGLLIASRWVLVMRGGRNPFVVLVMSSIEDAAGEAVPIDTIPLLYTWKRLE